MSSRSDRLALLTWGFVVLGLSVRLVRYLVVYPIWHDEAFLGVNFLDRGYLDLLRPLDYSQVSPILFLWVELSVVRLLGFSEWSLRLFPALCGLASVLLFRYLAGRFFRGMALLLAMGIFATAFYPIRHAAEIKPYASDVFSALVLLSLAVTWSRSPAQSRWWWILSGVVPILLALSYPAVLVAVGLSLALLPDVRRGRDSRVRLAYLVYNVVLAASFLSLYFAIMVVQTTALRSFYRFGYWRNAFPPWHEPWKLPGWLFDVHAGTMMAYPIGGERGASALTLVAVIVGAGVVWRRAGRTPLLLLLAPAAVGLLAAVAGRYPYGGAPRIMQYLAPSICLLAGLGGAQLIARLPSPVWRRRALGLAVAFFALIGVSLLVRDLIYPYRIWSDEASRRFAERLWKTDPQGPQALCVKCDLGMVYQPKLWKSGLSAVYLFHRGMYAQPRRRVDLSRPSELTAASRPLRLVFFDDLPAGDKSFACWLTRIRSTWATTGPNDFVVNPGKPGEQWLRERYVVLDLTPGTPGEARVTGAVSSCEIRR